GRPRRWARSFIQLSPVTQNVVLVLMDTARADAFEPYGAAPGSTPAVAQFARRGHAIPFATATASWTVPSHVSMFSGVMPRSVGLGQLPDGAGRCRPVMEGLKDRLMAEVLRQAG